MIDIRTRRLKDIMPQNLLQDEKVLKLSEVLTDEINRIAVYAYKLNYITNLRDLPEEVIDHLLWENHLNRPEEGLIMAQSLEDKINLLESSTELHRTKGTPHAIEKVLEVLGLRGRVEEWFEYGGDPYHFKITVNVRDKGIDEKTLDLLTELVFEFKNVRSYLEAIHIKLASYGSVYVGASSLFGEEITVYPWRPTKIETIGSMNLGSAQQSFETLTVYPQ